MMSAPQEKGDTEIGPVPYTVPPGAPQPNPFIFSPGAPQPNTMPINIQWNVQPPPGQPNGYPVPPMWNVSPGQPQMIYPTIQPAAPGYNVPAPNMPQVTQPSQWQQDYLQAKVKALGIVLISMAIFHTIFGFLLILVTFTYTLTSGVPFWGPVIYIIAGSLSYKAQGTKYVCVIKSSFAFTILSSFSSFIELSLNITDFALLEDNCYEGYEELPCHVNVGGYIVVSFLFVINLLVFCVSISVSVYGCRAVEQIPSNISQVFVTRRDFVAPIPSLPQAPPPYMV